MAPGPWVGEDVDLEGAQGTCGGDENVLGLDPEGAARTCAHSLKHKLKTVQNRARR